MPSQPRERSEGAANLPKEVDMAENSATNVFFTCVEGHEGYPPEILFRDEDLDQFPPFRDAEDHPYICQTKRSDDRCGGRIVEYGVTSMGSDEIRWRGQCIRCAEVHWDETEARDS